MIRRFGYIFLTVVIFSIPLTVTDVSHAAVGAAVKGGGKALQAGSKARQASRGAALFHSAESASALKLAVRQHNIPYQEAEKVTLAISSAKGAKAEAQAIELIGQYGDDAVRALDSQVGSVKSFEVITAAKQSEKTTSIKYLANNRHSTDLARSIQSHGTDGLRLATKHGKTGELWGASASPKQMQNAFAWSGSELTNAVGIRTSAQHAVSQGKSSQALTQIDSFLSNSKTAKAFLSYADKNKGLFIRTALVGTVVLWNHEELVEGFLGMADKTVDLAVDTTEKVVATTLDSAKAPLQLLLWGGALFILVSFGFWLWNRKPKAESN